MAFLLGCEKVRVDFPTKTVFENLTFGIENGVRIGIVGRNGDGKSTLVSLLAGKLEPDEGRVTRTRNLTVGFLGQSDDLRDDDTVERAVVGDMPEYEWAGSAKIRDIIAGLAADIPWHAKVGELSGGQRRRVDLVRLLIADWDVLMLDEPTNHLDMRAITWLAEHLKRRWRAGEGALLVVTHDRWFLDEVCTSMWEVHDRKIETFEGGFSAYILQRVERDRLAELAEQKRQNLLRRELAWLSRGARARATKPKFHVAAARALIEDVPELRNPIELKRMAMARLGKRVVDLENVTVKFGDSTVLDDVSWIIGPGDRFGIMGGNGAGKTTLLRVIEGLQEPTRGQVKIGQTVRFAVLSQHLDNLKAYGDDRVRQVIGRYSRRVMLDGKEVTPAQLLEKLGFSNADLNEPVCDLSGGQKRRLALMLILLDEPNVLILDEPGNDMDVDMLAVVEDMLDTWPGTLLLVTHDRFLMERVTDHQYAILDGKLRHLPGGVDEYLQIARGLEAASGQGAALGSFGSGAVWREAMEGSFKNKGAGVVAEGTAGESAAASAGAAKGGAAKPGLSGGEIQKYRKIVKSTEGKMETLRKKIAEAQERLATADQTDYVALTGIQDEIASYQESLEELELEWLEASEMLGD